MIYADGKPVEELPIPKNGYDWAECTTLGDGEDRRFMTVPTKPDYPFRAE